MTHLNETIYSSGMAAAHQSKPVASGAYINDEMLSNVCKHNVTRFPVRDRAPRPGHGRRPDGHHAVGAGSAEQRDRPADPQVPEGRDGVDVTDRMRILRLIENMTIGRNAVGYLTESLHGAGSPQAQRIQIARGMKIEDKKARARHLAGISERAK